MDLKIFDVEHGACALLTCDDQTRLMIDCGHNGTSGWRPGTYLLRSGITRLDGLAITNFDEDHVSGLPNLLDSVQVDWMFWNASVSSHYIRHLKSEDGMGAGIDRLVYSIERVFTATEAMMPLPTFRGMSWQRFHNVPSDLDDENNLSEVYHLNCNGIGVLFPGDLERAGLLKLLERESFRRALRSTSILVAPHHGRDSGCCEEMLDYMQPFYVVISDKGYMYDTQRTAQFYRQFTQGGPFRDDGTRHVLTTRRDGRIGFTFDRDGNWGPY